MLEILGIVFVGFILLIIGWFLGAWGAIFHYQKKYGTNWEQVMEAICKQNRGHPLLGPRRPRSKFLKKRQGSNGNE